MRLYRRGMCVGRPGVTFAILSDGVEPVSDGTATYKTSDRVLAQLIAAARISAAALVDICKQSNQCWFITLFTNT